MKTFTQQIPPHKKNHLIYSKLSKNSQTLQQPQSKHYHSKYFTYQAENRFAIRVYDDRKQKKNKNITQLRL